MLTFDLIHVYHVGKICRCIAFVTKYICLWQLLPHNMANRNKGIFVDLRRMVFSEIVSLLTGEWHEINFVIIFRLFENEKSGADSSVYSQLRPTGLRLRRPYEFLSQDIVEAARSRVSTRTSLTYWSFVRGIHRSTVDSPHKGSVIWIFETFQCLYVVT